MDLNYLEIVGDYFPDSQVIVTGGADPTVYESLTWLTAQVAKVDLDIAYLVAHKTHRIIEFSEMAREDIINGFDSSALGYPHRYDSEPEDQLNLIGSVTANVTMNYSCRSYKQGCQHIDVGGAKVGTDSTGYTNDSTAYSLEVQLDGVSTYLSFAGEDVQTFADLITQINTDADFSAVGIASLDNGNVEFRSLTYGAASTVNIIAGSLATTLTGYVGMTTAMDGIDGADVAKTYHIHTNAELLAVLNDGAVVKLTVLQKFNTKKEQVLLAADVAAVDAITW